MIFVQMFSMHMPALSGQVTYWSYYGMPDVASVLGPWYWLVMGPVIACLGAMFINQIARAAGAARGGLSLTSSWILMITYWWWHSGLTGKHIDDPQYGTIDLYQSWSQFIGWSMPVFFLPIFIPYIYDWLGRRNLLLKTPRGTIVWRDMTDDDILDVEQQFLANR